MEMILNDRQYKIASKLLRDLIDAIDSEQNNQLIPEWVSAAQTDAIESQIGDLKTQIREYEMLKSGKKTFTTTSDLRTLSLTLIQARISQSMTQADLAAKIGLNEQQIQRYEASGYNGASLSRLTEVVDALGIQIQESWKTDPEAEGDMVLAWQNLESLDWKRFPLKEMIKRKWITLRHGTDSISAIRDFFLTAAGKQYASALHRKKYHGKHKPDEYSLLAWQARVLYRAKQEVTTGEVPDFALRDDWLKELSHTSIEDDAPLKAKELLREHGIILIVEPHLPGTYLDGAAMKLDSGHPVVAITMRYDRLDHFWFVLFHELAHVFLHLESQLGMDYFDEAEDGVDDSIEREADTFALEALIPEQEWKQCLSRFMQSAVSVTADAKRIGIHPSIIAGRIRKENDNYTILSDQLGLNTVRQQFGVSHEDK
jgi:HTH-type transcriptional regulator / antitoxin HigA